ncbi:MAG: hypothetical protein DME87_14495 [Verrucomicrobia bacterium]|nr:MAG: hypothetical protein DME87_14495 [Verrucomicrobiota bacterium]
MTKEQKFSDALAVQVERRIFLVRGQKVMLDTDLAELYRVPTKSLNLAVKRNADRFPERKEHDTCQHEADSNCLYL